MKNYQRKKFFTEQFVSGEHGVNDYAIVLQPHEALSEIIMQEKKMFAEKFECPEALHIKPRVTLVHFKQTELIESKIVQQLKKITAALSPFKVELKNFGSYPSHTIYIHITSKVEIMHLVKELRTCQKLMKLDDQNKPYFLTEPNINIARKLLLWQYEKSWLAYEHKHFHGRFVADHLLLLKRKEGTKAWQTVNKFYFQRRSEVIHQGKLFG